MIGAILLGFVAGVVGRVLMPNDVFRRMSGPASWGVSLALGLAGALLGYVIFTVGLGIGDDQIFDFGGIFGAIIGVLILLPIVTWAARKMNARETGGAAPGAGARGAGGAGRTGPGAGTPPPADAGSHPDTGYRSGTDLGADHGSRGDVRRTRI